MFGEMVMNDVDGSYGVIKGDLGVVGENHEMGGYKGGHGWYVWVICLGDI